MSAPSERSLKVGFQAKVVRRNLTGIAREIHAAENDLKSAQWGVDRATIAFEDQKENLKRCKAVLKKAESALNRLLKKQEAQKKKEEMN
jgi:exonuclease VII small subunit